MEQRDQQVRDVRAVGVGVGQTRSRRSGAARSRASRRSALPIASLRPPSATRIDVDLGVLERAARLRAEHVQDLAADGQDRLRVGVAGLLGRAAGGVALDDEELALRTGTFGLSSVSASLPGRFESEKIDVAALRSFFEILDWAMRMSRRQQQRGRGSPSSRAGSRASQAAKPLVGERLHRALRLGVVQPALRLALELRLGQHHRHRGREAVEDVARLERLALVALQPAGLVRAGCSGAA